MLHHLSRLQNLTELVIRHGLGYYLDNKKRQSAPAIYQEAHLIRASQRLKNILQELGPTFVKFGQMMATRADLLPLAVTNVLAELHDKCAPFSFADVEKVILESFGKPWQALYSHFNEQPLACASVAQVHQAVTQDGVTVAVKVQRPGMAASFHRDMELLRLLVRLLQNMLAESGLLVPEGLLEELERTWFLELDFEREAEMLQRFRINAEKHGSHYKVPQVFFCLTSAQVLTMELIEGHSLGDLQPQITQLATMKKMLDGFFQQVFKDGLFHADPHPGNWFIDKQQQLVLLDFGSVGHISYTMRENLIVLILAISMRDADTTAKLLYRTAVVDERISLHKLRDACASLFDYYFKEQTQLHLKTPELLADLLHLMVRFRLRLPPEYALLARAVTTLEGILRRFDPELELLPDLTHMVKSLLVDYLHVETWGQEAFKNMVRAREIARDLPLTLSQILMDLESGKLAVQFENRYMASIACYVRQTGWLIFWGLVVCGLTIGSLSGLKHISGEPFWSSSRFSWPHLFLYGAMLLVGMVIGRFSGRKSSPATLWKRWLWGREQRY